MTPSQNQLLPDLELEEYQALKADIAARGVLVPVELDEAGVILDGHHRIRAWEELRAEGVEVPDYPCVIRTGLSAIEKRAHARTLNLARRHLNQDQKRDLIREQIQETPEKSNRQIAALLGVSHPTVAVVRWELEAAGKVERFTTSVGADGKIYPRRGADARDAGTLARFNELDEEAARLTREGCDQSMARLQEDAGLKETIEIHNAALAVQNDWAAFRLHCERMAGRLLLRLKGDPA
jgi:ParB-like chromosome segregation protein Spo0J